MSSTTFLIELPTGVSLEADLSTPLSGIQYLQGPNKLAVCLHPWSWLGGQKDDPVLLALEEPLLAGSYHVLRYNSRGVGKSTGRSSFTGSIEGKDLEAIIQWALEKITDVHSVVIIGYSYGSLIASLHPVLPPPIRTSHILLSYPLSPRGWLTLFSTSTYTQKLQELVKHDASHVLVVHGDRDEFTSITNYRSWVQTLASVKASSETFKAVEIPDASHFWRGRSGDELCEVVHKWLP